MIRNATPEECDLSDEAAERDNGRGVISVVVDGVARSCFVEFSDDA